MKLFSKANSQQTLLTSLVIGLVTLPIMGYVYTTNGSPLLLFGGIGLLLLILLLFSQPVIGLPMLLVIRPLVDSVGDRTIQFGPIGLNIAAILALVVIVWALWIISIRRIRIWNYELFWPIALLTSLSVLSLAYTIRPIDTIGELLRIGSFFLLYFMGRILLTTPSAIRWTLQAFAVGCIVPVFVAIVQVATNHGLTFADSVNRAYGTFGHPNVLAFYLVLGLLVFVGWRQTRQQLVGVNPLFLALLAIALALTQTRGALVGLALGLFTVGLVRFRRQLLATILAGAVILVMLPALNGALGAVGGDLRSVPVIGEIIQRESNYSSIDWRFEVWKDMSRRVAERPVFGFGLGTFPTLRQLQIFDIYDQGIGAHNDYLRLLVELGGLGLLSYVTLLISILWHLGTRYNRIAHHPSSAPTLFMIGFVLAFAFMSYFDNLLQATPVMWGFMILLAITFNVSPHQLGPSSKK